MKVLFSLLAVSASLAAQGPRQTMRPVIRGRQYAVVSMKPEATQVAERILRAGGNAFDAIVAGQAVLGIVDTPYNGVGGDAVVLIYDAGAKKVFSLNAEGTAPRLATIEWYKTNQGGKIPVDDTLLSGTVPGVVDAWYILLDRWGTMKFAEVLAPAIEMAENGFPLGDRLAAAISLIPKLREVSHQHEGVLSRGPATRRPARSGGTRNWRARCEGWSRPSAPTRPKDGTPPCAPPATVSTRATSRARWRNSRNRTAGCSAYEDFAGYTAKVEEPVWVDYRGYRVYKNASASQGPAELIALNLLEGYDLKALGLNSADYIHLGVEAIKLALADRDKYLGDMDFIQIPYAGPAVEGLRPRAAQADRSGARLAGAAAGHGGEIRARGGAARSPAGLSTGRATRITRATPATSRWSTRTATWFPSRPACTAPSAPASSWASSVFRSTAAATTTRWFRATPTRSSRASGREARYSPRW